MDKLWIYLILLFLVGTAGLARAQYSETKEVKRSFAVTDGMSMVVNNKYGRVEVEIWDKDSVHVEIKMEIKERKLSRLHKALDNIHIEVSKSSRRIWAETRFGRSNSTFDNELFRIKESISRNGSSSTKVDYRIFLPAYIDLSIENKFGDVYIDDFSARLEVELSNGKLKAHNLSGYTWLKMLFGGATINKLDKGRLVSNYSNVFIRETGKMYLSSKSSEIEFEQSRNLSIDSRRDKFRIGQIDTLIAESSFTDFRIDELSHLLDGNLRYGDFQLRSIVRGFDRMRVISRMADVGLYFNNDCAFDYEIKHSKTKLHTSSEFKLDKQEEQFRTGEYEVRGKLRDSKDEHERVKISTMGGQLVMDLE